MAVNLQQILELCTISLIRFSTAVVLSILLLFISINPSFVAEKSYVENVFQLSITMNYLLWPMQQPEGLNRVLCWCVWLVDTILLCA